jgi:aromatic ring hydroxylase
MRREEAEQKATHMDDYLKEMVVDKYKKAIDFSISGHLEECFKAYMALFYLIEPYDFTQKQLLTETSESLNEYIHELRGRPLNKADLVKINNKTLAFKDLLNLYMSLIPKAYAELGLWFKVITVSNDWQLRAADENFSSEYSSLPKKKEELKDLTSEQLLDLARPNAVHEMYSKWRVQNAL